MGEREGNLDGGVGGSQEKIYGNGADLMFVLFSKPKIFLLIYAVLFSTYTSINPLYKYCVLSEADDISYNHSKILFRMACSSCLWIFAAPTAVAADEVRP